MVPLSARNKTNMKELKQRILFTVSLEAVHEDQTLVTNLRHYESLQETTKALDDVLAGIANGISNDLLALWIIRALSMN
jgi:tRNA modification GTPase